MAPLNSLYQPTTIMTRTCNGLKWKREHSPPSLLSQPGHKSVFPANQRRAFLSDSWEYKHKKENLLLQNIQHKELSLCYSTYPRWCESNKFCHQHLSNIDTSGHKWWTCEAASIKIQHSEPLVNKGSCFSCWDNLLFGLYICWGRKQKKTLISSLQNWYKTRVRLQDKGWGHPRRNMRNILAVWRHVRPHRERPSIFY